MEPPTDTSPTKPTYMLTVDEDLIIEPCGRDTGLPDVTESKDIKDVLLEAPEKPANSDVDVKSEPEASPPYTEKDTKSDSKKEDSKETVMGPNKVCFAFGPLDHYFFAFGGTWSFLGVFHGELKKLGVQIPYAVAMGEHGRYFLACRTKTNAPSWSYRFDIEKPKKPNKLKPDAKKKWLDDQAAQKKFQDWTKTLPSTEIGLYQTSVTFGPGTSFFARSPASCESHGLPESLEARMKEYEKRGHPKQVALGIHDTWVAIWPDGSFAYDLSKHMGASRLVTLLKEAKAGSIVFVALSPVSVVDWFLETSDGIMTYAVDRGLYNEEHQRIIGSLVCAIIQARVKVDGRTIKWTTTAASGASMVIISPETNHTFVLSENNPNELAQKHAEMVEVSNKAAKKSVKASHVAIGAAALMLCTIM